MKIPNWFRRLVRNSLKEIARIQFLILRMLFRVIPTRVALTYDALSKQDGLGAQLQRILAIHSLSVDLRISYIHTGLADVAIHPLDPYQSESQVQDFLKKVNRVFNIESTNEKSFDNARTYLIPSLSNLALFSILAKSLIFQRFIILKIVEPYRCSDLNPAMYEQISQHLRALELEPIDKSIIGVHYRRGFGNFDIQKGEKFSRELEISTIVKKCNEIIAANNEITTVHIFTDAAPTDSIFSPPEYQQKLWLTNINFDGERLFASGLDVNSGFGGLKVPFSVVSGGDPFESLISLAHLDYLVLSRSSFGYVSALLTRRTEVWLPKTFWHPPLPSWFTY